MTTSNAEELFDSHPARAQLGAVLTQARDVLNQHGPTLDDTGRNRVKRVIQILEFAAQVIERADPELSVLLGTLDAVKQHLDAVASSLSTMSAANPGAVKQSVASAEAILAVLDRFPPRIVVEGTAELAKLISGLRSQQELILANATERTSSAIQMVTTAQEKAEKEIGQKVASAAELSATVERLQQQIGQQSGRLDSALSAFSTNSTTLEQKRETRYQEWLDKQTESFATRSADEISKVTTLLTNSEKAADTAIKHLEKSKAEAEKILNVIGNIGATGNYKLVADANQTTANWLRGIALTLFLIMVAVVVYIAISLVHEGFNWQVAVFRMFSALILALPAAYLARESARHREVAERMRRMELELASIDAFNALLPEPERNAIKAEMARKYFGNGTAGGADDMAATEPPMTLKEFLKEATSLVRAFRK